MSYEIQQTDVFLLLRDIKEIKELMISMNESMLNEKQRKKELDFTRLINTRLYECKCGSVKEIHNNTDLEWHICEKCKRRGCWTKQF